MKNCARNSDTWSIICDIGVEFCDFSLSTVTLHECCVNMCRLGNTLHVLWHILRIMCECRECCHHDSAWSAPVHQCLMHCKCVNHRLSLPWHYIRVLSHLARVLRQCLWRLWICMSMMWHRSVALNSVCDCCHIEGAISLWQSAETLVLCFSAVTQFEEGRVLHFSYPNYKHKPNAKT